MTGTDPSQLEVVHCYAWLPINLGSRSYRYPNTWIWLTMYSRMHDYEFGTTTNTMHNNTNLWFDQVVVEGTRDLRVRVTKRLSVLLGVFSALNSFINFHITKVSK